MDAMIAIETIMVVILVIEWKYLDEIKEINKLKSMIDIDVNFELDKYLVNIQIYDFTGNRKIKAIKGFNNLQNSRAFIQSCIKEEYKKRNKIFEDGNISEVKDNIYLDSFIIDLETKSQLDYHTTIFFLSEKGINIIE